MLPKVLSRYFSSFLIIIDIRVFFYHSYPQTLSRMLNLSSQRRNYVLVETVPLRTDKVSKFVSLKVNNYYLFCFFQSGILKLRKGMHYFENVIIPIN